MTKKKAQEALEIAKELAKRAKSPTDLHNAFFGVGGKFSELFTQRAEREASLQTPQYREICQLRAALAKSDVAS
jgi:hypothetical protein